MYLYSKCLKVWGEGWHCSLEEEVKILCQRGEEREDKGGEGGGGEGERQDGVMCGGGRLKECWLGCLQDGGGGINHYWRTPSSPTHPDGPSTPDINHHSPTIDPLSLPCQGKSVLVVLIFFFFYLCLPCLLCTCSPTTPPLTLHLLLPPSGHIAVSL